MTPTELRALIASEQLASLASANAENGWPCTNDQLIADAMELADLLLAKLDRSTPDPKSRLLGDLPVPKWQCLSLAKPERYQPCRVVVWDLDCQVKSIDRLYWDGGMWEDGDGNCALGDVPDLRIYWCPSHLLPNSYAAIRASFIDFIESR